MSSQLHQAIQLAQSGQRAEARALLLEFLQTHGDHEAAWLWLAAVAQDWDEYERALENVLRVNPANTVAQQRLDEFRQQRAAQAAQQADDIPLPPSPVPPTMVAQAAPAPPSASPSPVVSGVPDPNAHATTPPPVYGAPDPNADRSTPPPPPPPPPAPQAPQVVERVVERERVVVKRKGRGCLGCGLPVPGCGCVGCGCWQGCLGLLFLVIVLPALACFGLSYGGNSLGILDWPARYLPGRLGEKTLTVELPPYELELTVPRTWYVVDPADEHWQTWRGILENVFEFRDTRQWAALENTPVPVIAETDPVMLSLNGDVLTLQPSPIVQQDFTCATIRSQAAPDAIVIEYEGNICGVLSYVTQPYTGPQIFQQYEPPQDVYRITWLMPLDARQGVRWGMTLNTTLWDFYDKRLQTMAESVEVKQK